MKSSADNPANPAIEQGFHLGELIVDPPAGEVTGPNANVKVDPKVMNVLVLLARHARHVVPRDDMLAQLWPGAVVTDDALSRCIYELRRILSLASGNDEWKALIETLPKRGYRLNGEVTPLEPEQEPQPIAKPQRRPNRLLFILGAAVVAAALLWFTVGRQPLDESSEAKPPAAVAKMNSIAVLPFTDMSAGQDQGYLADGISEEIINRLTRSGDLRVISQNSSFSFRDKPVDAREIARRLNVEHVLEGSVRRSGDDLRITAQLIAAADSSLVWSETFDRKLGDLFAVQDEVAAAVASALSITLKSTAPGGSAPVSTEAYDLFLQGEYFYNRRGPGDVKRSADYYQQALAIAPGYARAWSALAGAYSLLAFEGAIEPDVGLRKQGEAARQAVALDPNLAVGYVRLAQYYWDTGDRKTSYATFDRALALDPDDPLVSAFAGGTAMRNGDVKEAINRYRRMVARDPLSASYHANLGIFLQAADKLEDAKSELRKALDLNPNFGSGVDLAIVRILVLQGRFAEASAAIARLPAGEARDHGLALFYHAQGKQAEANAAIARLVALSTKTPNIRLAEVYAFNGMTDKAFAALRGLTIAIDQNEPAMASQIWSWQVELRVSPFLKPLHADPRWTALLIEPA